MSLRLAAGHRFSHSVILLKDLADDVLWVAATCGYVDEGAGAQVRIGEGVIGLVGERRKMMRIGNIGASMRYLKSVRARMEASGQVGHGQPRRENTRQRCHQETPAVRRW